MRLTATNNSTIQPTPLLQSSSTFTSTKSTNLCTSILHRRFQPSSILLSLTRLSQPLGVPRDNPYPETSLASCLVVAAVFLHHNGRRYKCSDKTSRRRHSLPKRASRCLATPPRSVFYDYALTPVYC